MTKQEYDESFGGYIVRLLNAYRCRCMRTARARLRDLAKLNADYYGCSKEIAMNEAKETIYLRYNITL